MMVMMRRAGPRWSGVPPYCPFAIPKRVAPVLGGGVMAVDCGEKGGNADSGQNRRECDAQMPPCPLGPGEGRGREGLDFCGGAWTRCWAGYIWLTARTNPLHPKERDGAFRSNCRCRCQIIGPPHRCLPYGGLIDPNKNSASSSLVGLAG